MLFAHSRQLENYSDDLIWRLDRIGSYTDDILKLVDEFGDEFVEAFQKNGDEAVDWFKRVLESGDLSKTSLKHSLNRHAPLRVAGQFRYMGETEIEEFLESVTFFNKLWTEEQIIDALNCGYKDALSKGITTGEYSYEYLGDNIIIYLKDGKFQTGYGDYRYTYDELIELLVE